VAEFLSVYGSTGFCTPHPSAEWKFFRCSHGPVREKALYFAQSALPFGMIGRRLLRGRTFSYEYGLRMALQDRDTPAALHSLCPHEAEIPPAASSFSSFFLSLPMDIIYTEYVLVEATQTLSLFAANAMLRERLKRNLFS